MHTVNYVDSDVGDCPEHIHRTRMHTSKRRHQATDAGALDGACTRQHHARGSAPSTKRKYRNINVLPTPVFGKIRYAINLSKVCYQPIKGTAHTLSTYHTASRITIQASKVARQRTRC